MNAETKMSWSEAGTLETAAQKGIKEKRYNVGKKDGRTEGSGIV